MYLLDTNACIRILNNSSVALVACLRQQSPEDLFLCSVVKAELVYGAYRSSYLAANLRILKSFFEPFASLPFADSCLDHYGRIRSDLERIGTPIGPYDLMIAATALAYKLTLVTNNTKEFSRVAGLQLEDWQKE